MQGRKEESITVLDKKQSWSSEKSGRDKKKRKKRKRNLRFLVFFFFFPSEYAFWFLFWTGLGWAQNWRKAQFLERLEWLASRRKLEDLTVGPVLTVSQQSEVTSHQSHVTSHKAHGISHKALVTSHSSQFTRHNSLVTRHTAHS